MVEAASWHTLTAVTGHLEPLGPAEAVKKVQPLLSHSNDVEALHQTAHTSGDAILQLLQDNNKHRVVSAALNL